MRSLTVCLPIVTTKTKSAVIEALENEVKNKPFVVSFSVGPVDVDSTSKGVGPKKLHRWTVAAKSAFKRTISSNHIGDLYEH